MKTCCSTCCLDTQKSMGPGEIHWGVLRGLEDLIAVCFPSSISDHLERLRMTGDLKMWCQSIRRGIRAREQQACQPDLGSTKGDETGHLERTHTAYVGQTGFRPSQNGIMKSKSCLTNFISFYDWRTWLVDEGKVVDVVCLDFSKAFDTIFSWRSWKPMVWTGTLFAWLKTGWMARQRE